MSRTVEENGTIRTFVLDTQHTHILRLELARISIQRLKNLPHNHHTRHSIHYGEHI